MKKDILIKDIKALNLKNDPNIIFLKESIFDDLDYAENDEDTSELDVEKTIDTVSKYDITTIIKELYTNPKFDDFREQIAIELQRKCLFFFDCPNNIASDRAKNILSQSVPLLSSLLRDILEQMFQKKNKIEYQYCWYVDYNAPDEYQRILAGWLIIEDALYPRLQDLINWLSYNIIKDKNYLPDLILTGKYLINGRFDLFNFCINYASETLYWTPYDLITQDALGDFNNNITLRDVLEYLNSGKLSIGLSPNIENNFKNTIIESIKYYMQHLRISYTAPIKYVKNYDKDPIKGLIDIFDNCVELIKIIGHQLSIDTGTSFKINIGFIMFDEFVNDKKITQLLDSFITNKLNKKPNDITCGFTFTKDSQLAEFDGDVIFKLFDSYAVNYSFLFYSTDFYLDNTLKNLIFKNSSYNISIVLEDIDDEKYYSCSSFSFSRAVRNGIMTGATHMHSEETKNYNKDYFNFIKVILPKSKIGKLLFQMYIDEYNITDEAEIANFNNNNSLKGKYVRYAYERLIDTISVKDMLDDINSYS